MRSAVRAFAVLALAVACAQRVAAAEPGAELHGMADAFAAPGVTLAWGVLRGADEAGTAVVLRVVADPAHFASVAVAGRDPFTGREVALREPQATGGVLDFRVPRTHFAAFPRTELRLFDIRASAPGAVPKLVVYYLGVPDTTPEFATADRLDAYLAERIARLRAGTGGKPP